MTNLLHQQVRHRYKSKREDEKLKKTLFFSVIVMLLIGYQLISICVAQNYTKWNLPEGAIARLGKGNINEIAFSPDGTKFAVSTSIGVWIYGAENGKELVLLKSDEVEVVSSVFTPDGKSLISAAANGETHLWNVTTGEKLSRLTDGNDIVKKIALSDDSTKLVTNSIDDKFRVYDLKNPITDPLVIDDTEQRVNTLEFSTDGEIIAATKIPLSYQNGRAVKNFRLQVWNTITKNLILNIPGDEPYITAMLLLPDENTVITADLDNRIQIWNIAAGLTSLTFNVSEEGNSLAYASNSRILASCNEKISLWDISSNGEQATLKRTLKGQKHTIIASEFSPDENTLVTASNDGAIVAWDVKTGKQLFNTTGHTGTMKQLAFSETGDTLISVNSRSGHWIGWDSKIHEWDLTTNSILSSGKLDYRRIKHFSPDCRTGIVAKENGDIEFLDIKSEERRFTIKGFEKGELNVYFTFSADGKVIATNDKDDKIHVWRIADLKQTSKPWRTLTQTAKQGGMETLSADGHTVAIEENSRIVHLWSVINTEYHQTLYDLPRKSNATRTITGLRFSPDGKTIVTGNQEEIRLWDTKTGNEFALCIHDRSTDSMVFLFSPDSSILISACGRAVLDFDNGGLRTAPGSYITRIYSENYGGTFQLWDVKTGELLSTHTGHTNKINTLAFSGDGKTLATGGADGTILLWDWEKISTMR